MKRGFYYSLACDGMKKNRKMYLPYILTCIGMVMMLYIVLYLQNSEATDSLASGIRTTKLTMGLGAIVITVFSVIFLFYTNSFLMRRRRREFGLYNMLGMSKRNICRILAWEVFITFVISLTAGLAIGIAFSKLAELALLKVLNLGISYDIFVSPRALLLTTAAFAGIFLLLMLNSVRQVRFSTAMALMQSENYGERPPKANWAFGIGGFCLLAAAYYIALSVSDPISAMFWFFGAVIMVIIATYMIFVAGAVMLCKILQNNKKYYYKASHFISTSNMAYRMKRNGAGLASICILATMVLVMLSSTTSLYFGTANSLKVSYPREINIDYYINEAAKLSDENFELYTDITDSLAREKGVVPQNVENYRIISNYALAYGDGDFEISPANAAGSERDAQTAKLSFMPLSDYNAMTGSDVSLSEGEVLASALQGNFASDAINIENIGSFSVKGGAEFDGAKTLATGENMPVILIVTSDFDQMVKKLDEACGTDEFGNSKFAASIVYDFDTGGLSDEEQIALADAFTSDLGKAFMDRGIEEFSYSMSTYAQSSAEFYASYGGLFFLAIMLSIVFIFAAVLIIYYKQISEGYEDRNKFAIMQKVGMTKAEIRKSINSQVLTVFALPLLVAALHMVFAFPMIKKILLLFQLTNSQLFLITTAVSFCAFALLYVIVYRITSKAYYNIVSEA